MIWLKQGTAVTVKLGPFVDDADGVTALTALTISQADIRLSKNGGDIAQTNNATGATHDELGYYDVPLDTTDTATLGALRVLVSESGALPVWADFMVVPANVWDSLFGADKLQVHADEITAGLITAAVIATDAIDADALAADAIAEINATVDTAISDAALATAANLSAVAGYLDTEVAAILADTNELQTDLADGGRLDLLIDAIKAVTDALPNSGALTTLTNNVAAILADTGTDGVALSSSTLNAIADALLSRGVDNVEDTASTLSLTAIVLAVLESAISGTTWTIRKSDGTTFTTKTVATDGSAEPIVSVT